MTLLLFVTEVKEENNPVSKLSGNGFKLFRFFGEKGDKQNVKGEQIPTTNKNWFSSIFASDKGKASVEQGT